MFANVLWIMERDLKTLDIKKAMHRHCMHSCFIPALQQAANDFVSAWNHHYIQGRGRPVNLYRECCRWHLVDIDSWEGLKQAGFTVVGDHPPANAISAAEPYTLTGDPVTKGMVPGFSPEQAAELCLAAKQSATKELN